jgi:hypothetical protein
MKIVDALKAALGQASIWWAPWNSDRVESAPRGQASAFPFENHWRNPFPVILDPLFWLGAQALSGMKALARSIFALLTEASADVGDLFIRRHGGET